MNFFVFQTVTYKLFVLSFHPSIYFCLSEAGLWWQQALQSASFSLETVSSSSCLSSSAISKTNPSCSMEEPHFIHLYLLPCPFGHCQELMTIRSECRQNNKLLLPRQTIQKDLHYHRCCPKLLVHLLLHFPITHERDTPRYLKSLAWKKLIVATLGCFYCPDF